MQQTGEIQRVQPQYTPQTVQPQPQYAQPQAVQAQPEQPKKHTGWGSYGKNLKEKRGKKKTALVNLGFLGSLAG
jgi:hypothetical protein